ncbi:secreted protein [Melampsora americana]|nr:secreted protein [Melampsora americana]
MAFSCWSSFLTLSYLRINHFQAFTFLSLLSQFTLHVRAGYSVQDCGLAWAPHVKLTGHPPLSHPGYYCKNSGGVEYGCEICHTFEFGYWHACHFQPAWGFRCGDQALNCGDMAADCRQEIVCGQGYSFYGIYAHCWEDNKRYKCVPGENGRAITRTVCHKCLIGTGGSGPPS